MSRIFTEEEKQYIVSNWGKISINKMRKHLNCTWEAVQKIGIEYGLELPKPNIWSKEEEEKLKSLDLSLTYYEVALILNRDYGTTRQKAKRMGLKFAKHHRWWDDESIDILKELWGYHNNAYIAKVLGRTEEAIEQQAGKLGLGCKKDNNLLMISISDLAKILGIDSQKIITTWKNKGLRIKKIQTSNRYENAVMYDQILIFLEQNQDLWDSKKLEKDVFGEEPEWLVKKREVDKNIEYKQYEYWSTGEFKKARKLLEEGYSYSKIAEDLNKSVESVKQFLNKHGYFIRTNLEKKDVLNLTSVCYFLGVSRYRVGTLWKNEGLEFTIVDKGEGGVEYHIKRDDLKLFLKNNQGLWNASVLKPGLFEKETWLINKINNDKNIIATLMEEGFSAKEIAKRTGVAIKEQENLENEKEFIKILKGQSKM